MILKVISKHDLHEMKGNEDLAYWLSRPPAERISAVEILRRQYHGSTSRLQRLTRVVEQTRG